MPKVTWLKSVKLPSPLQRKANSTRPQKPEYNHVFSYRYNWMTSQAVGKIAFLLITGSLFMLSPGMILVALGMYTLWYSYRQSFNRSLEI